AEAKETDDRVRAHFRAQSKSCGAMGSPFMEGLLETAADKLTSETAVGARILRWQGTP
ncbi:unnamed protein product, partial [Ectocarpus sp. 12 AP-2014]